MPSRIDKDQCLAGPLSRENGTPIAEQTDGLPALRMALYIDKHRLVRDCISEQLASHLSQWTVESLASMSELKRQGDLPTEFVVVLHAHSASVAAPEVTSEIAMIAEAAPGVPFVVMSDLEDATEALLAIQVGGSRLFASQPAAIPGNCGNPICGGGWNIYPGMRSLICTPADYTGSAGGWRWKSDQVLTASTAGAGPTEAGQANQDNRL